MNEISAVIFCKSKKNFERNKLHYCLTSSLRPTQMCMYEEFQQKASPLSSFSNQKKFVAIKRRIIPLMNSYTDVTYEEITG